MFDPTGNATALFAYTQRAHPGKRILWSQGNEVNFWKRNPPGSATMAKSINSLKAALLKYTVGDQVYGPSYAEFDPLARTLLELTNGTLAGLTEHHYPLKHDCSLRAFLERKYVDWMAPSLAGAAKDRREAGSSALLVLEEIGGAYGGG